MNDRTQRRVNYALAIAIPMFLLSAATLSGCGGEKKPAGVITQVAPANPADAKTPPPMTTKERLRVHDIVPTGGGDNPHASGNMPADHIHADGTPHVDGEEHPPLSSAPASAEMPAGAAGADTFAYDVPQGWQAVPATPMRAVNLKAGANSECYVSVLGGGGGGLASNLNRWRKQMGQPELSETEITALPKRTLLGKEATLITIDGTFSGMGGGEAKANYRLLGLATSDDSRAVFVKLTGPQAEIEKEAANFDAFVASLKEGDASPAPTPQPAATPPPAPVPAPSAPPAPPVPAAAGTPPVPMPVGAAAGGFDATKLQWSAPSSWQKAADRMMRLVTYTVGQSECYITVLDGPAGGVEANLNRWRGQMSQPDLTADEIANLPKITIMGKEASLIEASGTYTTMSGQPLPGQKLLGAICLLEKGLLTVKMTGPEAEVNAELDNFKSFCTSIASN